mgnify:CR=1 FL=1
MFRGDQRAGGGDDTVADDRTNSVLGKLRLAAENWDIPIVVTTNVQFFESLYADRSSRCRKLHNLAKAVIIFDETQMLPRDYIKPCLLAVYELARNYGASAVFCTATQPIVQKFLPADARLQELAPDPAALYRFYKRVQVQNAGKLNDEELVGRMNAQPQALCIVNTSDTSLTKPGDVAAFATPPAFRWVHFSYALQKGLNVFMEKPVTVDGPSTRRMLELADKSEAAGQKVGVGLMWRHCKARQELVARVKDGQIGDVVTMRCYRLHGPIGSFAAPRKPEGVSEVLHQIRYFHGFLWASGGAYSDFYIHNIDELCWLKDAWPVEAHALGGRHYRGDSVDQNFDNYSVEYVFPDGTDLYLYGRCIHGCEDRFSGYVRGSKGLGTIESMRGGAGICAAYHGQKETDDKLIWRSPPVPSPYQLEWDELIDAIRQNKPYNEARRGAIASLVTSMGRMAAHTGRAVTYDQMLSCDHEFAPDLDKLAADGPPPLKPNANGVYPVPMPGIVRNREY